MWSPVARPVARVWLACLLILVAFGSTPSVWPRGYAAESEVLTLADVRSAAIRHVRNESRAIPAWEGAVVGDATPHYSSSGNVDAYLFPVLKDSSDAGYVLVSAQALPNPVIEFSTAPARLRLAHVFAGSFGVEPTGLSSEVPGTTRPSDAEGAFGAESLGSRLLYGPDYDWYRGCGPTALANVMGYWADRGYPSLVADGSAGEYRSAIDQLAALMGTSGDGWTRWPIDDDVRNYAAAKGYSFQSSESANPPYGAFVGEIDAHRPAAVLFNGHVTYGDHYVALLGYEYDANDPNYRYLVVHDSWGNTPVDARVQFGAGYSLIRLTTVVPPSVSVDTTPPSSSINVLPTYQAGTSFRVSWSGADNPGGWGLKTYDVQYRDGLAGAWTDWLVNTGLTSQMFTGSRGHTYYFRTRAMDIDHNLESYPSGDGDSWATVARYALTGKVQGNSGRPVLAATIRVSPGDSAGAVTGADGAYQVGLETEGSRAVSVHFVDRDGRLGSLPDMLDVAVPPPDGARADFVLPPAPDLLRNGDFETGELSEWRLTGTTQPTLVSSGHTGDYAVRLTSGSSEPRSPAISQTLSIPGDMSVATLSLMYRQSLAGASATVSVIAPSKTLQRDLEAGGAGWKHSSISVSELAGQSVEVRIELRQALSTPSQVVTIDEVSLGPAWPGPDLVFLPIVQR
jgi:hypothetical protein